MRCLTPLLILLCSFFSATLPAETDWIWTSKNNVAKQQTWGRASFDLAKVPAKVQLLASGDNHVEVWVNGQRAGGSDEWNAPARADIAKLLKAGHNTIAVLGRNDDGIAAFAVRIEQGKSVFLESNPKWRVTNTKPADSWMQEGFDDSTWELATVVAKMGAQPWGNVFQAKAPTPGRTPETTVASADSLILPPGFKADLVYLVPRAEQGSWISLIVDPKGDLIAGDQAGVLWHISLANPQKPVVTRIETEAKGCHGLLYAYGAVYALTSEKGKGDLWRLRDPKGDNSYSEQTLLRSFKGSGEHGPHQLITHPDGSILVVAGNHTTMPADEVPVPPHRWDEDDLLKKFEDPNGHAVGIKATGGWIGKVDRDGKNFRYVTTGFRNAYDITMAPDGDIFVYDSDMEWDMGAPWYRPTRINLATDGGELGWRSGSANNPPSMVDTQPSLVDIGPGSPTGSTLGLGAKFPAKYQRTFFACDWTYATLYAIHVKPEGAAWSATKEVFAGGKPFSLTDVVIRPQDGNMYVTIGGRGSQSALYRISYIGKESTAPVSWYESTPEQRLRRELEALRLQPASPATLAKAWPLLGHSDRWIRFAARLAVEAQPVDSWRNLVKEHHQNSDQAINAALALARCGTKADLETILKCLDQASEGKPNLTTQRDVLRVMQVAFSRHGMPSAERAQAIGVDAAKRLPSGDNTLDRQLAAIAIFLQAPNAPAQILQTMRVATHGPAVEADPAVIARNPGYAKGVMNAMAVTPASTRIGLAVYLVRATAGWTPELRKEFFRFLNDLGNADGGHSLKGFVKNIRKDALAAAPANERAELETVAPLAVAAPPPQAAGPGRLWSQDEATKAWNAAAQKKDFDFENGQKMFAAALCSMCHRMGDLGGAQGPDLTGVGSRMNPADLIMNIVLPSAIISDQYANSVITRIDGGKVIGRILNEEGDKLQVGVNPFDPSVQVTINRSDIQAIDRSDISPMPVGLLNSLNEKELTDLVAFLVTGGNKADKLYKK